MSSSGTVRGFAEEVAGRFGILPNLFYSAPAAPGLIEELWAFTKSADLDCALPALFKERLFVHLSRFCDVRYCIVRHVGFLMGEGRPAGDAKVPPQTLEQIFMLLRRPVPDATALEQVFLRLETRDELADLPMAETQDEADLFDALTVMFLAPGQSQHARRSVRHAVGAGRFEILTAFLAFVRTAHYWTETHPELGYEPDMLACMEKHPELARLLLDASEAEQAKASAQLRNALDQIHAMEGSLRDTEQRYQTARREADYLLHTSEERLKRALETDAVGVLLFDKNGVLISGNDVFMRITGWSREDISDGALDWRSMTAPEWIPQSEAQMRLLAEKGRIGPYEKEYLCKDGSRAWMLFTGRDLGDGTIVKFAVDISERKRTEAALRRNQIWLAAQKEAFQAAMNGAPLQTSLGILIDTVFEQTGGDRRCAFYIADANGTALHHVVGMPESYAQRVDGFAISAESLACGLAIATGEPVITPDVLEEPRWRPWTWLAREYDYRGCWSFPVETSTGKRVGTLAMYFKEPREPTTSDRELAAVLTQTAAFVIARHQEAEERTRIHRELVKSQQDLAAELAAAQRLQGVSTELASGRDIRSLYDKLIGAAMFIMRADFASMQIISAEHGAGRHLRLLTFRGFSPRAAEFWKSVQVNSSSTCGLALKTGQRAVIRDVASSDVLAGTDDQVMYLETGIRAVQSTPLVSRSGDVLGMISTHWRNPHQPAERDLGLLDILARQAADLIERASAESALRESEARFRQFGEASSDILWVRDAEALQWEYVSPAFETIYGVAREDVVKGNNLEHWTELIEPEDRERAVENLRRVRGGERVTHEFRIRRRSDGEIRWIRNTDFPLADQTGRVQRIGGIGQDVTGEKATADRLQVMVAELQHRTRNLIAVVRSIAAQTMAMTGPTEVFRDEFNHRLEALARVQGLLSRSDEKPITVERLIRIELDALGGLEGANGRITLKGPSVRLRSSIVQTLALALHELATNARKHGALSNCHGRLRVTWQLAQAAEGPRLGLEWIETATGIPIDTNPARRGYGRELIEKALPYALGATTTYELSAEGARCMIDMPLERPRRRAS